MIGGHGHGHGHGHGQGPLDHGTDEMPVMDATFWDERYRATGAVWSGRPNPQLVAEATELAPGTALDVGCGEGADAIWLAARGWSVIAVDISRVALDRAAAIAGKVGAEVAGRITWQQADLSDWVPEESVYDLVSAQFMQLAAVERDRLNQRLAAAVAPGGTLLVVGHHPADLETTLGRPRWPQLFFTAEDVAATLDADRWQVLVAETRARAAVDPDGRAITIYDAVLRAQKRQ